MTFTRRDALKAIPALLAGCGGGGSGPDIQTPAPVAAARFDGLFFGYYGGEPGQTAATADHIGIAHPIPWDGLDAQVAEWQQAKARGIPILLDLPEAHDSEKATRERFELLAGLDLLRSVKAIYPMDEPDYRGLTAQAVGDANAMVRRVALGYGLSVPLAALYSAAFTWPGVASYDWVGFDNYGADIFSNGDFERLKRVLSALQRILLAPGGCNKWRQDPAPFLARALADPQVIGMLAFIYRDNADPEHGAGLGIKSNGMLPAYRSVGLRMR